MNKWIDLSNLPHSQKTISWKDCSNNKVEFLYRGCHDFLYVIKRIDVEHVLVRFNEKEFTLPIISLQRCCLGKLFDFAVKDNYTYKKNEVILIKNNKYRVVSQERLKQGKKSVKGYFLECFRCKKTFSLYEGNLFRGDGCPYCSHHKIDIGNTDLWSSRPDVACLLKNKDDGFKYAEFSNKSVSFVCKQCGNDVGKRVISSVSLRGLNCQFCGRGKSYPNKLMYNVLKSLNISFETEKTFDWCSFPSYSDATVISFGIYDFVIESMKLIIEMDGGIGHGHYVIKNSRYSIEDTIYRDSMKDSLALQNGYEVIRIDCNYMGKDNKDKICKKNILSSKLSSIFDLNAIDWDFVIIESQKNVLYEICEMYNQNLSSGEIAEILGYDVSTVIDYLHKGTELALCNFIPQKVRRKKHV